MVNIWKIGAWPGILGEKSSKNKEKYIQYALDLNSVAFGFGYTPDFRSLDREEISNYLRRNREPGNEPVISRKTNEIWNFSRIVKENDVFLLYHRYKAYVGIAKKNDNGELYYYVDKNSKLNVIDPTSENNAPHRINVAWENGKEPFDNVNFSMWRDTLHQVTKDDMTKIKNDKLKKYLLEKLKED